VYVINPSFDLRPLQRPLYTNENIQSFEQQTFRDVYGKQQSENKLSVEKIHWYTELDKATSTETNFV